MKKIVLALLLAAIALPATAARLSANPQNLAKVWSEAKDGDTIALAPGDYPAVMLKGRRFAKPVTLVSEDPVKKAVFSELEIIGVKNLAFRQVELVCPGFGKFAMHAQTSEALSFDHIYVHGSLDGDPTDDGQGLMFHNVSDVTVANSEFTELRQAIADGSNYLTVNGQKVMGSPDKAAITGNHIHLVMKTGILFAGVSDVTIVGNTINDIRVKPPEHPDAIQFFTTNTTSSAHDITIHDNLIFRDKGSAAQGIFFRDQMGNVPYLRVTITDNLIVGTGWGGISVSGINGLTLSGNELVSNPGKENNTWLIVNKADDVRAENNRAQKITFDGVTNLKQSHNAETSPVKDEGAAALAAWASRHPAP